MRLVHGLPLSQLEVMTFSYIPLFAVTYVLWRTKAKDVLSPSLIQLPDMSDEQRILFESMAVSNSFDDEKVGKQDSFWTVWYLTPRVFEKEAEDRALQEAQQGLAQELVKTTIRRIEKAVNLQVKISGDLIESEKPGVKEAVVANWDPELYRSKTLWPLTCLFGASFGTLHLISWNTEFPTHVEQWLWRAAAIASTISMLVFMQFEKVVVRWGDPLTIVSLVSPVVYLLSRVVMMGGVIAAFRASDPAIYNTYVVSTYCIHVL